MVTVGSIWSGTLRFIGNNIASIVVWSGIMVVLSLVSMLAMAPFQAQMAAMQPGSQQMPNMGGFFVAMLVMLVAFVVMWAAAFRAVLFPERNSFFYLRVGMDELRLFGVILAVFVGGYIAALIAGLIASMLLVLIGRLVGGYAGAGIGGVLGVLLVLGGVIWAAVRISPCGPLTIYRKKVMIGQAWRLTHGAFWRLFGAYVLMAIVMFVAYMVIFAVELGASGVNFSDPQGAVRTLQAMQGGTSMGQRIMYSLLTGIVGGLGIALQAGMTGVATRQLLGLSDDKLQQVFE